LKFSGTFSWKSWGKSGGKVGEKWSEKLRKIRVKSDPKSGPKSEVLFHENFALENEVIFGVKF